MKIMKNIKFHKESTKTMKILEFNMRIIKIIIFFRIPGDNDENHENHIIPLESLESH